MNNIHFITFANSSSGFSLDRIRYQAETFQMFSSIETYTEKDFSKEYLEKNIDHFKYTRGYGYWSWKPYFIKEKMAKVNYGDFLLYADCGCTLKAENKETLVTWMNMLQNPKYDILSPCHGPLLERDWTRYDLFDYIDRNYNKDHLDLMNMEQSGGGILLIKKSEKSVEFVNIWNDIMENHFDLCTDSRSSLPNLPGFKENRHDQSVFSLLVHIYDNLIKITPFNGGMHDEKISPVLATRIKNDKYTFKRPT